MPLSTSQRERPHRILFLTEHSDRAEMALISGIAQDSRFSIRVLHAPGSRAVSWLQEDAPTLASCFFPWSVKSRFDFAAIRSLRHTLLRFSPHVVHAFTSSALSTATLASILLRNPEGSSARRIGYRGTAGNLSRLNPADWVTYLNPSLTGIMCVSEAVRSSLISFGLPHDKLFTVYKGHDVRWYHSATSRAEVRSRLGISEQSLLIGTNANMRPVKGIDLLLHAAKALPLDGSVQYLLVGEIRDPVVRALAKSSELSSVVHCLGYRTDATELMHACDVFAMPSRAREGLPKAIIEAMSGGVPVVAAKVGGIPEVVRHGVEGLLAEPEDVAQLAHCLSQLIQDPNLRLLMGAAAKKRIEERFTVSHSVNKLSEIYTALLSRAA